MHCPIVTAYRGIGAAPAVPSGMAHTALRNLMHEKYRRAAMPYAKPPPSRPPILKCTHCGVVTDLSKDGVSHEEQQIIAATHESICIELQVREFAQLSTGNSEEESPSFIEAFFARPNYEIFAQIYDTYEEAARRASDELKEAHDSYRAHLAQATTSGAK